MKKKMHGLFFLLLLLGGCFLIGCAKEEVPQPEEKEVVIQSTYVETLPDSLDEAVVVSVSERKKEIRLYNLVKGRNYTLAYDGTTTIKNVFGDELVPAQLSEGDMVRVTFIKDEKKAKSFQLLDGVTTYHEVDIFDINKAALTMEFKGERYELVENCAVLSGGKQIQLEEIHSADRLKIVAEDHTVYSITVEKGHGYVRLFGHEAFEGGWVEIGQAVITEVTNEMLLVVPEGSYTFYISHDGVAGSKEIVVNRDEETVVDVSDIETEKIKKSGKIIFTITPADAELFVDGEQTDYSEEVEMGYGIHQIMVKAEGYSTVSKYIKVGSPTANINIDLDKSDGKDEEEEDKKESSVSGNSVSNITSPSNYRVYIDAPKGAELYLDGTYVGVVPTNFAKKEGSYVISLRKDGYQTRSYTLQIDDEKKDVSYSFSDLTAQ